MKLQTFNFKLIDELKSRNMDLYLSPSMLGIVAHFCLPNKNRCIKILLVIKVLCDKPTNFTTKIYRTDELVFSLTLAKGF